MTFDKSQYELIDFGSGEKLERFGNHVVRRQTPSVAAGFANKRGWNFDAAFRKNQQGQHSEAAWTQKSGQQDLAALDAWSIKHDGKTFALKLAPSGQVGVFPEQALNWKWIEQSKAALDGCSAINLFGYTGGTTMALAQRGVNVTHVDAAKPAVEWARENARASGLADASIRWIVDDALSYMRREVKRGREYQIVVADPPSFGRGPKQSSWKIQRDLETLFELAGELTERNPVMFIFSCHTPGVDRRDLKILAAKHLNLENGTSEAFGLKIDSSNQRPLSSGDCFRWQKS